MHFRVRQHSRSGMKNVTSSMAVILHLSKRLLKRVALTVAIVGVGIAAAAYIGYRRLSTLPEQGPSTPAAMESMVVERVHQSATRDGRTEWSLDAATAQYRLSEKDVLLTDLFATFFTRDDQKVYLTARHGTVMTESHDMEAYENVVIYNDTYRLETGRMTYSHDSRIITSDEPVTITGPAGNLMADSLRLDLKTNRLVMRGHVRGTMVTNDTP
jgi:LPS export ABC transporter protein LptC